MSDPSPAEFLSDPLSDVARRERRNLLIASTTGVLVSHVGLVPTRLSALGIEFSAPAQSSFVVLVAAVITYFIGAFVVYGCADFFIWRKRYYDYLIAVEREMRDWDQERQRDYEELHTGVARIDWVHRWSGPLVYVRVFFEFALPILVGAYAVCSLALEAL